MTKAAKKAIIPQLAKGIRLKQFTACVRLAKGLNPTAMNNPNKAT